MTTKRSNIAPHDTKITVCYMKKSQSIIARCLLVGLMILTCATGAQAQRLNHKKSHRGTVAEQIANAPINHNPSAQISDLLAYAFTFKGTPYVYGVMSPKGFDCSGFTSYVFKKFGIRLNRTSRGQVNDGRRVTREDIKPGDLVFFNGRAGRGGVGHVGIVTESYGDGTFRFIHAACSSGVRESKSTESYYRSRYVGACRVIE